MSLRETLSREAVGALRIKDAVTIGPAQSVGEAIEAMQRHRSGCVVVTEHGRATGIFTERDVLRKVLADGISLSTPIATVMTRDPATIRHGCSVAEVIRAMHRGGFRHIPVVEETGAPRGIVSVKRIVQYLVEHFPASVFNLPPVPEQKQLAREGA